jgi:hypothetical protein
LHLQRTTENDRFVPLHMARQLTLANGSFRLFSITALPSYEIRRFGDDPLIRFGDPCQRQFQSLLTELLCNPFGPLSNEIRRVALIWSLGDAPFNHRLKSSEP